MSASNRPRWRDRCASVEKGRDAVNRPIQLGGHVVEKARYQVLSNLVAEPMEAPDRSSCCWQMCRSFLCAAAFFIAIICVLDTTLEPVNDGGDSRMAHRNGTLLQQNPFGVVEPNTITQTTVETTLTTTMNADNNEVWIAQRFQLSLTVNVEMTNQEKISLTLANDTGFFAIHEDNTIRRNAMTPLQEQLTSRVLRLMRSALSSCCHSADLHVQNDDDISNVQDDDAVSMPRRLTDQTHNAAVSNTAQSVVSGSRHNNVGSKIVGLIGKGFNRTMPFAIARPSSGPAGLYATVCICLFLAFTSMFCHMHQGPYRPHPSQHGQPRQHVHQSDAGPPFVGTATLKVPPSWSLERNHLYSLRSWVADLVLRASASDLEPQRHGPIAALQIQGSARELVRELTPQQLQHGDFDPITGQQLTGLMLLVQVLARRYAPLEAENTTKSISEFLSFRRLPNEPIDSTLVRFDILRNRAHARAGFAINFTGLSWLLLQSLNVPAEVWDRLLAPLNGQLPNQEHELQDLMERLRRLFHLREGRMSGSHAPGATGDNGNFYAGEPNRENAFAYFPTFDPEPEPRPSGAYAMGGPYPPDPWQAAASAAADTANAGCAGCGAWDSWQGVNHSYHANSGVCQTCGTFLYDGGSTDTSTDNDMPDGTASEPVDPAEVYQEYAFARKKWRRMSGKFPRRYRKWGKGSNKGSKGYAAFLPSGAFAGGKGGGNKGSGPRKNPKDRNGEVMKCRICNSDEHLWRRCPRRDDNHGGKGASYPTNAMMSQQSTQPQQLALMSSRPLIWGSGGSSSVMPGVHFYGAELEQLRSVSQSGSVASSRKRVSSEPEVEEIADSPVRSTAPAPTWSPGNPPGRADSDREVTALITGMPAPAFPPPSNVAPPIGSSKQARTDRSARDESGSVVSRASGSMSRAEQQELRDRNSAGLTQMLLGMDRHAGFTPGAVRLTPAQTPQQPSNFSAANPLMPYGVGSSSSHSGQGGGAFPWWETDSPGTNNQVSADQSCAYHLRTRSKSGQVGILIDPGAHDNLVGSITAKDMAEQNGVALAEKTMDKSLPVEGVGKDPQVAQKAIRLSMAVKDTDGNLTDASYTAPQIEGSLLPPLLGNKTLRRMQSLIDCGSGRLILPGPGGVELKLSPGTLVYDLEFTPSGHWILPLHPRATETDAASKRKSELQFNMSVREARSQSPKRQPGVGEKSN